jgi:hypothetical protein
VENRVIPQFSGIPGFFKASCCGARSGGSSGYDSAGRELARHLKEQIPYDLLDEPEVWNEEIKLLRPHVEASNDQEVLRWFIARFPNCMAMVPKRRRDSFLRGAYSSLRRLFEIDEDLQ